MTDYHKAIEHLGNAVGELAKGRTNLDDVDLEGDASHSIDDLEYFVQRVDRNRPGEGGENDG